MKTWHNDSNANLLYDFIKDDLQGMVNKAFRGLELSHIGLNRNMETGEVVLKLHLNEKGKINVSPSNQPSSNLIKG